MLSGAVFTGLKPCVYEITLKNPCQGGFRTNANGLGRSFLISLQPDKHTMCAPPVTDSGWQGQAQLQVVWSKTNKTLAAIEKYGSKFREVMNCGGVTLLLHRLPENLPRAMIYIQLKALSPESLRDCRYPPKRGRVIWPTRASLPATECLKTLYKSNRPPLGTGDKWMPGFGLFKV